MMAGAHPFGVAMASQPHLPRPARAGHPRPRPPRRGDPALARRLAREIEGEVLFDPASRGRYATDASLYQVEPIGVAVPANEADVARIVAIAAEAGAPLLPRGGGTSQCGQTVGEALVVDFSKHLDAVLELDLEARRATVQPGLVLDRLNRRLRPHGLFFPVDVSTADRATLGGMAGNNSCGARSIRYGNMVHNVHAIEGLLADGTAGRFGWTAGNPGAPEGGGDNRSGGGGGRGNGGGAPSEAIASLAAGVRSIASDHARDLARGFPDLLRRVGGYNLDTVDPAGHNLASLLVGSEGTLALFTRLELDLQPIPPCRALAVCHFPTFRRAMEAVQHIVRLNPAAVELVDRTMIDLARGIAMYRPVVERFVRGEPDALLLVEFAGEDPAEPPRRLAALSELLGELGLPGSAAEATRPEDQAAIWEVRKAGLNIMMSMKGEGKPVSFIEDCAVRLEDLPDYTDRLNGIFERHGTTGTWYAHASVGCLHVRPILNLKHEADVRKMRAIAEETFAVVREYRGSHSGEHGDGLVRSEFHEAMFGPGAVRAFEKVKDAFDPHGRLNPGKIVRPPRMDDRSLFRYPPGYRTPPLDTALDWSQWGGFAGAVEMCNNNGECRKRDAGVMCPSYRATGDERHVTRGRANTLRLALSGQLEAMDGAAAARGGEAAAGGADGLAGEAVAEALELCVSCKGCRRECPTGVDMARMKIEFLYHYRRRHGLAARERLIAWLPRYAPFATRAAGLLNAAARRPALARLGERWLGLSARRPPPPWRRDAFRPAAELGGGGPGGGAAAGGAAGPEVVLFADTFTRWFEPEVPRAAVRVMRAAGYAVRTAEARGGRPLCCGRTFLTAGLADRAREEARRTVAALLPFAERGTPVVGLEPSCLLSFRDELPDLLPGPESRRVAEAALLFEEWLARERERGALRLRLDPLPEPRALLHGHCHQKAFGAMAAVEAALSLLPGLEVETVRSSCCGMAGAFGHEAEHFEHSMRMGELSLLPAVRGAGADTRIVAGGTSCRRQIADGAGRRAWHPAEVLASALAG